MLKGFVAVILTYTKFCPLRFLFQTALLILSFICVTASTSAQITVQGTVYDASKKNPVADVRVESTNGKFTTTDSTGKYKITVMEKDSLTYTYLNKTTLKFAVSTIANPLSFDISLHIAVSSKYKTLKEVMVYSRTYQQDSIENRQSYADVYNFRKPTIRTSITPDGMVGADVNEIINMFRFKRNKYLKAFQARLEKQEQEQFVEYRFNKSFVRRATQLKGAELDSFMVKYQPSYEFASTADEVTFHRYVLNASYQFKIDLLRQQAKKPNP